MKRAIWILIGSLGLSGCASLLDRDFKKATLIAEVELGNPSVYARTIRPPSGSARLIVAIPNYRCAPVRDAPIGLTVRGNRGTVFSEHIRLSQLTWAHGEDSCDAYGYLYDASSGNSSPKSGEMRLSVEDGQSPLTFEVDVSKVTSSPNRRASIWLIYGDRVPGAMIFGEGS